MLSVPELNLGSIDAINYRNRESREFQNQIFYREHYLEKILEHKRFFVIGEKGTGKTSYAVFLSNSDYLNTRASVRSITDTDYSKFIQLRNRGYFAVSEYSDVWRVIILLLMADHVRNKEPANLLQFLKFQALSKAMDEYYANAFSPEVVNTLKVVEHSEVAASVLAKHLGVKAKKEARKSHKSENLQTSLQYIEHQLRDALASLKLERDHIVFIDGIDIRPEKIDYETYVECIKGLALAVWSLNTGFLSDIKDSPGFMKVAMLIRPDILDRLGFQNLNAKVRDNGVVLNWVTTYGEAKTSRIFRMIDGLLGKQQKPKADSGAAWGHYFPYQAVHQVIAERMDDPFIGFLRYSFYRPRDIICYLQLMQEDTKLHEFDKFKFGDTSFKRCQQAYSDYLLGEVRDYLSFYYSRVDFGAITGFFSTLDGRSRFTWSEFVQKYDAYMKKMKKNRNLVSEMTGGPEEFLQFLYSLNIVGYVEKASDTFFVHWCFHDRTPVALTPKVQFGLQYNVHPGLARALRVGG